MQLQIQYKIKDVQAYLHKDKQTLVQVFNVVLYVNNEECYINIIADSDSVKDSELRGYIDAKVKEFIEIEMNRGTNG